MKKNQRSLYLPLQQQLQQQQQQASIATTTMLCWTKKEEQQEEDCIGTGMGGTTTRCGNVPPTEEEDAGESKCILCTSTEGRRTRWRGKS